MPSNSRVPQDTPPREQAGDDEPDVWDKRISDTGCAAENTRLNDCFFEKKDWRMCQKEVRNPTRELLLAQMEAFKECWRLKGNRDRTDSRDN
ncbi:hypothetical protein HOY82DRAFT_484225 [Tuber indicum]|nr:hypothetical protein HOY82DRAFT_484225 [Tuber indicum]